MLLRHFLALAGILALAACGNTTGDRALSGGAIGAGTRRVLIVCEVALSLVL
jgi:hypothetical protein